MSTRTELLERQLTAERAVLGSNLQALGARAEAAVDWKARVRSSPLPMVGAGLAVGALLGVASRGPGRRPGRAGGGSSGSVRDHSTWNRLLNAVVALAAGKAGAVVERVIDTMTDRWLAPDRSNR